MSNTANNINIFLYTFFLVEVVLAPPPPLPHNLTHLPLLHPSLHIPLLPTLSSLPSPPYPSPLLSLFHPTPPLQTFGQHHILKIHRNSRFNV